jgi:hypothetical protein
VEACVDPGHVRAQILADDLDLVAGLLLAHVLEVLLPGATDASNLVDRARMAE